MLNWLKKIKSALGLDGIFGASAPKSAVKTINYLINDPTTGDVLVKMVPPAACSLKTSISGYAGGGYAYNTPQGEAASCYVTINTVAKYLISLIDTGKTFTRWAAVTTLAVSPRAGRDFNAYYDRRALKFFYDVNPKTKKMVYTSESTDVVAHEFGHAFLDILRPDLWSAQSYEAWAFHESFGDIVAICNIMQYDQVLTKALTQTGNDLRKSNIISRLAEELGKALSDLTGDASYAFALRDATNSFVYVDPSTLPEDAPNDQLCSECHSFSRVWTATWYEMMVEMFKQNLTTMPALPALKLARDTAARYVLYGCQFADTVLFYNSCANQMLHYDLTKNMGKYQNVMKAVFKKRNIISDSVKALGSTDYMGIMNKSENIRQEIIDEGYVWKTQNVSSLSFHDGVSALSGQTKPFTVDLPYRGVYIFDKNKTLLFATETTDDQVTNMAKLCVKQLERKGMIGEGDDKMFSVQDGKLVRSKITGCCQQNNACDPNAPEYGKPWKGENNAGCGSKGATVNCDCNPQPPVPAPKLGCFVSTSSCQGSSTKICQTVSRRVC